MACPWTAPSHFINQCWNIVNWTLRNKLQWNFNRNSKIFIQENAIQNVVCEMTSILSRPHCVNSAVPSSAGHTQHQRKPPGRQWNVAVIFAWGMWAHVHWTVWNELIKSSTFTTLYKSVNNPKYYIGRVHTKLLSRVWHLTSNNTYVLASARKAFFF